MYYLIIKFKPQNMTQETNTEKCLVCEKTSEETPLFILEYKQEELRICPAHVPLLIHEPQKPVGKLDNADQLQADLIQLFKHYFSRVSFAVFRETRLFLYK
jgi:hypothetical protein